jgi:hypothetical protein
VTAVRGAGFVFVDFATAAVTLASVGLRTLLAVLVTSAAQGAFVACGSTAPVVDSAGPTDATVDGDDAGRAGGDERATEESSDGAAVDDASDGAAIAVLIIPCSVGSAFFICETDSGTTCTCTSDGPNCGTCDDAGCVNYCEGASCVDQCGSDQMAMGCGGNPPPPGWHDAGPNVSYVFAEPPDACALAPQGDRLLETRFYCCPRAIVDP